MRRYTTSLNIRRIFGRLRHPQSNGQIERCNQTLKRLMGGLIGTRINQNARWIDIHLKAISIYNRTLHRAHGQTPFKMFFKRNTGNLQQTVTNDNTEIELEDLTIVNRDNIETNINKAHGSLTTPRENEAPKLRDKSTERSRRETEQPRSARFETLKPNKHTNTEIDLNRRTNFIKNDNLESRLFTTDSFLLTLPNATEITKDNQNVFFPASSTSLIPIVSASKYKQESEVTPRDESNKHQNKKHKKHKSKGKRKQKSQTEDNRESFNIWPVNDDENAAYATINADITTKDRRQHRDRSSDQ